MKPNFNFSAPRDIVKHLSEELPKIGLPGSIVFIAKLLGVYTTTVSNWLINFHTPNKRHTERIGILIRLVEMAKNENADAYYTIQKMAAKDAPQVLVLGRVGFMAVTGLSWALPFFEDESNFGTQNQS
ncbi:MAG: hypothetical protein NUW37_06825 [Planctomycetes bacterium]|nr:hypothetical protein [Planctomycetota bacterium]